MKYRDHKGSLDESLQTVIEVNSINEIKDHLNEFYNPFGLEVEEIKFKYTCMDNRIGWNTWYVLQRFEGEKSFSVAGMSDGIL